MSNGYIIGVWKILFVHFQWRVLVRLMTFWPMTYDLGGRSGTGRLTTGIMLCCARNMRVSKVDSFLSLFFVTARFIFNIYIFDLNSIYIQKFWKWSNNVPKWQTPKFWRQFSKSLIVATMNYGRKQRGILRKKLGKKVFGVFCWVHRVQAKVQLHQFLPRNFVYAI